MNVIVQKYIYARIGQPSTEVAFSGYRSPGEVITMDDIVLGTEIQGNSIWYHSQEDGCYYWSGGFSETNDLLTKRRNDFSFKENELKGIYKSAANELSNTYRHLPGYKGMAVGYKVIEKDNRVEDKLALVFYVASKSAPEASKINKTIPYRGILLVTDVRLLPQVNLHVGDPDQAPPYLMGGSLASVDLDSNDQEKELGSRSLLVLKRRNLYLLTCYHVACSALFEKKQYDFNNETVRAHLPSRVKFPNSEILTGNVIEGGFGNNYDYALLEVDTRKLVNRMPDHPFDNGYYSLAEINQLTKDTELIKYGAAEPHLNRGFFKTFHSVDVTISEDGLTMSGLIEASCMSKKGDSGAPVVDKNNKYLGFIVAGDEVSSTFILPIASLEFNFHFSPDL